MYPFGLLLSRLFLSQSQSREADVDKRSRGILNFLLISLIHKGYGLPPFFALTSCFDTLLISDNKLIVLFIFYHFNTPEKMLRRHVNFLSLKTNAGP